jgi:hypothetical protein
MNPLNNKASNQEIDLEDNDYNLIDGMGWFSLKKFSIKISEIDDGIAVGVYKKSYEDHGPLFYTRVFDEALLGEEL